MKTDKKPKLKFLRLLIYLAVIVVLAVVLIPQYDQLVSGIKLIPHADLWWLLAAVGFLLVTYIVTTFVYMLLAKKPIKFLYTFLVQIGAAFANRIIPAGLGGMGLNADYLIKNGHSGVEAGTVVAMNTIVAIFNHATLVIAGIIIGGLGLGDVLNSRKLPVWLFWLLLAAVIILVIASIASAKMRKKIKITLKEAVKNLKAYKGHPLKIFLAYIGAGIITLSFVAALYSCAQSIGLNITFVQTFVTYTIGVIIGAAALTPGGLGGVEAGMYAAFVAYGNSASKAFAAVIIYRLTTYWLPILPGFLCFVWLRKNKQV